MKTILVTGGGGFIGSNLVAALLERGTHRVVVCDRFGSSEKWRNLSKHPVYNIIDPSDLCTWLEKHADDLEMIFHLGGVSSTTENDIDHLLNENFRLSTRIWHWCNKHSVRLLYTSSYATYGDGSQGFEDRGDLEYLRTLKPMSGYGWSKHLFDVHVAQNCEQDRCPLPQWVGLKLFNVYGPNEYHKEEQMSVISKMANQALQGAAVRLFKSDDKRYADGEQQRDMMYVSDAVNVFLWFLDHPRATGLFNLGTGKPETFNAMAQSIFSALGRTPNIHYFDMPQTLQTHYQNFTQANISKLREAGYDSPFMSIEQGITDYMQNYRMRENPYR